MAVARLSACSLLQVVAGIAKAKARNGDRCCSSPTSASAKSCGSASVRPGWRPGVLRPGRPAGVREHPLRPYPGADGQGWERPGSRFRLHHPPQFQFLDL